MKSAKVYPTYRVGDCSTEYPVPRGPMPLWQIGLYTLACTFLVWIFAYPLFNEIVAPLLIFMEVL